MKHTSLFAAIAALGLALPGSAHAFGIGPYFEYGGGSNENAIEYDANDGGKLLVDQDYTQFGFGVTFDSAVAKDDFINYRGSLGIQFRDIEADVSREGAQGNFSVDLGSVDLESIGVAFDNVLGFALVRTPDVRLWAGPALRLGGDFFDSEDEGGDRVDFLLGIGPEVGLNIHTGDLVSIALTAGYLYQFVFSALDVNADDDFNDDDDDGFDDTGDGTEHLFFGRINVFFRIKDTF